jgi:beta-galactosidase
MRPSEPWAVASRSFTVHHQRHSGVINVPEFSIGEQDFLLDGEPFRIISGAIHYFRVHPDQWADRIHKARLMGLNTIETYIAWNEHAPLCKSFDTSGRLDLRRFLQLVADEGMYAIVRPGPYMCAEWDNGGLPAWLFQDPEVGIRRSEPRYLAAVAEYFRLVLRIIEPMQVQHGGPVILLQVENEYGAYGADKDYLRALVALIRSAGIALPLTTIDQPTARMLEDGSLPDLHKTASFGSRAKERLQVLRNHQPYGPLMCAEFWDGWFDHWGMHHHTTSVAQAAQELDDLLAAGASVNIYMFHGGTNFGFTNGANDKGVYQPTVTSYDYDAPLAEDGSPTEKYHAFREVIARYASVPHEVPAPRTSAPVFTASFDRRLPLWKALPVLADEREFEHLPTMDELEQFRGFALYSTEVAGDGHLGFVEVRDRAQVFLDKIPVGVLSRDHHDSGLTLPSGAHGRLDILVEDQGRVNYGPRIGEAKGLIGPATIHGRELTGWSVTPLLLDRIDRLVTLLDAAPRLSGPVAGPSFVLATFDGEAGRDLFLETTNWGKGVAWLNGFPLGRYWSRGPQHTLYVPGPVVREGTNELILFELQGFASGQARSSTAPDLGHVDH